MGSPKQNQQFIGTIGVISMIITGILIVYAIINFASGEEEKVKVASQGRCVCKGFEGSVAGPTATHTHNPNACYQSDHWCENSSSLSAGEKACSKDSDCTGNCAFINGDQISSQSCGACEAKCQKLQSDGKFASLTRCNNCASDMGSKGKCKCTSSSRWV